jgi:fucose permease
MVVLPARLTLWPSLLAGTGGMIVGSGLLAVGWSSASATWAVLIYGIAAGPVWPIIVMLSQCLRQSAQFTSAVIGIGALGAAAGPLAGSQILRHLGIGWLFPVLMLGCGALFALALVAKVTIWRR